MPIAVLVVVTFGIMALKRGVDWPLAFVAMSVGDRSNGTIIEEPVNMIGNFIDKIWFVAVKVFGGGDGAPAEGAMHVARMAGLVG